MKQWNKVKGIEGLYRNANGKYYASLLSPGRHSERLEQISSSQQERRIKELKISESNASVQKAQLTFKSLGDLVGAYKENELPRAKVSARTKLRINQALNALKQAKVLWSTDLESLNPKAIHRGIDSIVHLSNASKNYSLYSIKRVLGMGKMNSSLKRTTFAGLNPSAYLLGSWNYHLTSNLKNWFTA